MSREYKSRRKIAKVTHGQETPETAARVEKLVAEAEDEYGVQVNFRWGRKQLDAVREVADSIGIPYQTYLKQVVYFHALSDLQRIRSEVTEYAYRAELVMPPDVHYVMERPAPDLVEQIIADCTPNDRGKIELSPQQLRTLLHAVKSASSKAVRPKTKRT